MKNRLANEKSPYLQQHSENPVDWFPWCDEAFEEAKKQNKPIFLSIGYSTCHWCHVMERESFEDVEIAKMLNDTFVNIKVDREERPDIDHIYMTVAQMLTGGGGWPLSIFMTSDKKPFYTGTYFPKEVRPNIIGMRQIIERVKTIWNNNHKELLESADEIYNEVNLHLNNSQISSVNEMIFEKVKNGLAASFDSIFGGFGQKPKFPSPHNYLFLMNYYKYYQDNDALEMVEKSLYSMRNGGIYDSVGFGFHRYSTDKSWMVPHFEKMLYDNATLLNTYTDAFKLTNKAFYKDVALEITEYVTRDLLSPQGAFYSAEDADSEGEEGKFYLWTIDEIRQHLIGDVELFCEYFNISEEGNYIDEIIHSKTGKNILYSIHQIEHLSEKYKMDIDEIDETINNCKKKLLKIRNERVRPFLDDKILSDWNGLMIASIAKAGITFQSEEVINTAEKAMDFILNNMFDNKKLLHRYKDGDAGIDGMFDDYSFIISALIELYNSTFNPKYLNKAIELTNLSIENFYDEKNGGFYFAKENTDLIIRKKEIYDGAIPSGNSVMIGNLMKLYTITCDYHYSEIAIQTIKHFANSINQMPNAYTMFAANLFPVFKQGRELIIYDIDNGSKDLINQINLRYFPDLTIILINDKNKKQLIEFLPYLDSYIAIDGKSTYYLCSNFVCNQPETDVTKIFELL